MVNINATLIAQILNFLFLVFVLAKFAYKPLLNIMEERKNKIAADLEAADAAKGADGSGTGTESISPSVSEGSLFAAASGIV